MTDFPSPGTRPCPKGDGRRVFLRRRKKKITILFCECLRIQPWDSNVMREDKGYGCEEGWFKVRYIWAFQLCIAYSGSSLRGKDIFWGRNIVFPSIKHPSSKHTVLSILLVLKLTHPPVKRDNSRLFRFRIWLRFCVIFQMMQKRNCIEPNKI